MKKIFYTFVLALVVVLVTGTREISASNKEDEENIKKLISNMRGYEDYLGYGTRKVRFTKEEMTKAAALSMDYRNTVPTLYNYNEYDYEPEEKYYYTVSSSFLKKAGQNIFGKKLKRSYIPKKNENYSLDVLNTENYGLVIYEYLDSGERAEVDYSIAIKNKGNGKYKVVKKAYRGAVGIYDLGANIEYIYSVKKSSKSKYGFVITGMQVKDIEQEMTNRNYSADDYYPVTERDIEKRRYIREYMNYLREYTRNGLDNSVFYTCRFLDLNKDGIIDALYASERSDKGMLSYDLKDEKVIHVVDDTSVYGYNLPLYFNKKNCLIAFDRVYKYWGQGAEVICTVYKINKLSGKQLSEQEANAIVYDNGWEEFSVLSFE